jgi:hypothetical protein
MLCGATLTLVTPLLTLEGADQLELQGELARFVWTGFPA